MPRTRLGPLSGALVLAGVATFLFCTGLGGYPLLDPDEARHAEVAREMAAAEGLRGFLLPTLEGEAYREKPPGHYWLVALAYRAWGVGEWQARVPGALAGLVAVLALYAGALRREGPEGALAAGLVGATSIGWLGLARYATVDMTLTACIVVGVLAGLAWLDREPPRRAPLLPWVAAGLGVLVKGPVAAVLIAGPLALAIAFRRPRPALRELGLARGVGVAAAIVAAAYVPIALLDASYVTGFAETNLRRFGAESPHAAPALAYLLWIPLLLFPWTILAVPAVVRAARDPERRVLLLWAACVPVLLALPRGKLPTYALSAVAPLALLAGPALVRNAEGDGAERAARLATAWIVVLLMAGVAGAAAFAGRIPYPITGLGRAALAAAALAWGTAAAIVVWTGRPGAVPVLVLGATLTFAPLAVRAVLPAVAALHSDREAARVIARAGPSRVIAFAARMPSLVFYLGRPVVHVEDPAETRALFEGDGLVFLVTGHRHFAEVEAALGARAHPWHGTARRRVYGNRSPPVGDTSSPRRRDATSAGYGAPQLTWRQAPPAEQITHRRPDPPPSASADAPQARADSR